MKIVFFDAHAFEQESFESANAALGESKHELVMIKANLNATTAELARGADAISIFVNDNASREVLDKLNELGVKRLALRSAGFNHVDMKRAQELGFRVANVPAYSPYAVAEHAVALMLALNRKIVRASNRIHDLNFSLDGLVGFDMNGKTVGVVGTGKIGAITTKILHGFGCKLLCYDVYPNTSLEANYGARFTDLDTLCRESDIITLHAPLTPETKHLVDATRIAQMKRGVMLVNTSRGGLVNTADAIEALKAGHIGYFGIDVYEQEQGIFFNDFSDTVLQDDMIARLMTFPNVLITSHQAFLTHTALHNIAETTLANVSAWAAGSTSPNEIKTA
ncbi:MAG: 2-hydroxyacid dehydrogenase [Ignavibacteria bacterium]|nr:2-hydroxyacid dehydrogenase [Ignavibacteria bacterium]